MPGVVRRQGGLWGMEVLSLLVGCRRQGKQTCRGNANVEHWSERGNVALVEEEPDGLWWTTVESAVGLPGMGERGGSSCL